MNKYSKQKLSERHKNTAKQTKRIIATFDVNIIVCFTISLLVNKAISTIRGLSTKFSTESRGPMPKCYTHISLYKSFDIAPNILYTILSIVNCNECLSAEFIILLFYRPNNPCCCESFQYCFNGLPTLTTVRQLFHLDVSSPPNTNRKSYLTS